MKLNFESDIRKREGAHILMVGKAVAGIGNCAGDGMEFTRCESIFEAIKLCAEGNYDSIFLPIKEIGAEAKAGIEAIRRVRKDIKLVLLAEMCEEAEAKELVDVRGGNGADDYLIYPVERKSVEGAVYSHGQGRDVVLDEELRRKDRVIAELEKLATEDDLTKIKNRRYFREFLRQIIEKSHEEELEVTVFLFDIDNFKHYNDKYGHPVGDEILKGAATLMQKCCRGHDIVGRIGGDEFAVIFWDCPNGKRGDSPKLDDRRSVRGGHPVEVKEICERFIRELSSAQLPWLGLNGKGTLTISGGLASFPVDGKSVDELFEMADKALIEAKNSGKNRIYLVGGLGIA